MTGREALLEAFDRLFLRAAAKLHVECTENEMEQAKQDFAERFSTVLDLAGQVSLLGIPEEVMRSMESAIDRLPPAELAGHIAAIPLVQQTQAMLRQLAHRAAERRLIEHLVSQADDSYGGN
jgi:hypothetical protein